MAFCKTIIAKLLFIKILFSNFIRKIILKLFLKIKYFLKKIPPKILNLILPTNFSFGQDFVSSRQIWFHQDWDLVSSRLGFGFIKIAAQTELRAHLG